MYSDREKARLTVKEFLDRGYGNSFWDDLVATPRQGPYGCVLQYLAPSIHPSRWPEVGFLVGRQLRSKYPNSRRPWNARNWAAEIDPILDLIACEAMACAALPPPRFEEIEPRYEPDVTPQSNGFIPWRLLRKRPPVPSKGGVYVLAFFHGLPERDVDLLSKQVIYIGYTGHDKNRRNLGQRLNEFEQTALGGLGHSAGWTYRTEFAADWPSLRLFRNTYVSWRVFERGERPTAREFERDQIDSYHNKWGARPFLNRRD